MTLDPNALAIVDALTMFFPDRGDSVTDAVEAREILAALSPDLPVSMQLPSVVDRAIPGPESAPEIPVRNGLQDAYAATTWVATHAAELKVDPARLAVAGDSAGGNFAAVVSLMARDRAAQGISSPAIAYQLLIYPSVDLAEDGYPSREENATGYFLTTKHMAWFHEQYVQGADISDPYMSPIHASDHSGLPRACVVTAEHDPLRDEGDAYAAKLIAAGVEVDHFPVEGMFHGFLDMPHATSAKTRAAVFAAVRAGLSSAGKSGADGRLT